MPAKIELFQDKKDCCGCGACVNICPKQAILLAPDEHGYLFPQVDHDRCIGCGLCMKVCAFRDDSLLEKPQKAYAAASTSKALKRKSASGGIFAELAREILAQGGVVFGAAYGENLYVHHIGIKSVDQLEQLQDSKYVQSDIESTYAEAKNYLKAGKKVLFSGTPCQIAGLRGYLGNDYPDLYTVDLLCHGVPSYALFRDGISSMVSADEKPLKVSFRDKESGWGKSGYIRTQKRSYLFDTASSSYYYYFQSSSFNRESCYNCMFAQESRPSDITLGDYWRIESAHVDYDKVFSEQEGISCVLANTEKGMVLLQQIMCKLDSIESTVSLVKKRNGRLHSCHPAPVEREVLLKLYQRDGYAGVHKYWVKTARKDRIILKLKDMIPFEVKKFIKKLRC